jgi:hypothetical protein
MDDTHRMPGILRLGMWLSFILAGVCGLVLVLFMAVTAMAPSIPVNGRTMTPAEFYRENWALLGTLALFAVTLGVIGAGLRRERRWVRPWALALAVINAIAGTVSLAGEGASPAEHTWIQVVNLALLVLTWWYLYRKPSVVAYYRGLPGAPRES